MKHLDDSSNEAGIPATGGPISDTPSPRMSKVKLGIAVVVFVAILAAIIIATH
jgi:hypothetical protein